MSALGQKQTYAVRQPMSALPPKADMCGATGNVRYGPKADMAGLEIDHQLERGQLYNWQVGWLLAFENPADIDAYLTICIPDVARIMQSGHSVTRRQRDELIALPGEECIGPNEEGANLILDKVAKALSISCSVLAR